MKLKSLSLALMLLSLQAMKRRTGEYAAGNAHLLILSGQYHHTGTAAAGRAVGTQ